MSRLDDEESADATSTLDVTPRTDEHTRTRHGSRTRTYLVVGGIVVLLGALGLVVFNGLTDAATFYYNVDEAVSMRDELGDQRFRMQGNVIEGSIDETDTGVEFVIAFGDAELPVSHVGTPPELFNKHDSTYEEENDARLRQAQEDAELRSSEAG